MIFVMEHSNKLIGQRVLLPDNEPVTIENIYSDGVAAVRRVEGELAGTIALCALTKLQRAKNSIAPRDRDVV
jgi:hypothetical protein